MLSGCEIFIIIFSGVTCCIYTIKESTRCCSEDCKNCKVCESCCNSFCNFCEKIVNCNCNYNCNCNCNCNCKYCNFCKSIVHPIIVEQDIIIEQPNLVYGIGIENNNLPKYGEEVIYDSVQVYKIDPPPNYIP